MTIYEPKRGKEQHITHLPKHNACNRSYVLSSKYRTVWRKTNSPQLPTIPVFSPRSRKLISQRQYHHDVSRAILGQLPCRSESRTDHEHFARLSPRYPASAKTSLYHFHLRSSQLISHIGSSSRTYAYHSSCMFRIDVVLVQSLEWNVPALQHPSKLDLEQTVDRLLGGLSRSHISIGT
jgi:hypothetical protein